MNSKITLFLLPIFLFVTKLESQTIWLGPSTTVTKANYADWNLEANQDRITNNVWITRKNNQPIFNIAQQTGWPGSCSGVIANTEWAVGTTADLESLTFGTLASDAVGCALGNDLVGTNLVLHIIDEDIYIDMVFTSWTENNSGGGFSYQRSTNQILGLNNEDFPTVKFYPNPTSGILIFNGTFLNGTKVEIFDISGRLIISPLINSNKIDVHKLNTGLYFLKIPNKKTLKFFKA